MGQGIGAPIDPRDSDIKPGANFGSWTVLSPVRRAGVSGQSRPVIDVRCPCGYVGVRPASERLSGPTSRCTTCAHREAIKAARAGFQEAHREGTLTYDRAKRLAKSHHLTAFGETKPLKEWAEDPRCIVSRSCMKLRVQRLGWDLERAITTPGKPGRPKRVTA